MLKFADDTKIFRRITSRVDNTILQDDLDKLVAWSQEWKMLFNSQKCKVMHFGRTNTRYDYCMNGNEKLSKTEVEKDLGVVISKDMKVFNQCSYAYGKANKMLGLIRRNIQHKNKGIMLKLYKSLVRPHVEYCSSAWYHYFKKDVELIEKIQHYFTRMLPDLKSKPYKERLQELGLWTLEERRNRSDMIEVFKVMKGLSTNSLEQLFETDVTSRTRGHSLKLVKNRFLTTLRQHSFSQRVISRWNSLDEKAVSEKTVNGFKKRLESLRKTKMGLFMD